MRRLVTILLVMPAGATAAQAQTFVATATAADGVVTFPTGLSDRPFPGWAGPVSLAFGPTGKDLYAGAGPGGGPLVVRYTQGGDGKWYKVAGPTAVVSTNGFPGRNFAAGVSLAPGPDALRVSLGAGGPAIVADADPVTLAFRSQRWVGPAASNQGSAVAAWSAPACPVPQTRFAWGDRGRFIYLCFEDDSTPETKQAVVNFVGEFYRGPGIDLRITTYRPAGFGGKLPPGWVGTVRVVHPEAWFQGATIGGGSRSWTDGDDPSAEKVFWVKGNDSWQNLAHVVCHEMGHAGSKPMLMDLTGPTSRPGNLMNKPLNMGVTPDRMRLDADQLAQLRLGFGSAWQGGPDVYKGP